MKGQALSEIKLTLFSTISYNLFKVTLQADYHFIFKIKFGRVQKFEILRFFTTVLKDD